MKKAEKLLVENLEQALATLRERRHLGADDWSLDRDVIADQWVGVSRKLARRITAEDAIATSDAWQDARPSACRDFAESPAGEGMKRINVVIGERDGRTTVEIPDQVPKAEADAIAQAFAKSCGGEKAERLSGDSASSSIGEQILALAHLRDGWFYGAEKAYDRAQLEWLADVMTRFASLSRTAQATPNPGGKVLIEFGDPPADNSVEVDLATRRMEWRHLDHATGAESSGAITPTDATPAAEAIRKVIEGGGSECMYEVRAFDSNGFIASQCDLPLHSLGALVQAAGSDGPGRDARRPDVGPATLRIVAELSKGLDYSPGESWVGCGPKDAAILYRDISAARRECGLDRPGEVVPAKGLEDWIREADAIIARLDGLDAPTFADEITRLSFERHRASLAKELAKAGGTAAPGAVEPIAQHTEVADA